MAGRALAATVALAAVVGCGRCTSSPDLDASEPSPTRGGPANDLIRGDASADGSRSSSAAPLPPAIPNAAEAIDQTVRPSLRACFAEQLRREPTAFGSVTFTLEVGPDGKVTSATPTSHEGLDDRCIACMIEGAQKARFTPPLNGLAATVIAPFAFRSSRDYRDAAGAPRRSE